MSNLENIQKLYPIGDTLIGFYSNDGDFIANCFDDVKDIDRWDYAPLDWGEGALPFVVYNGESFICWAFCYDRVCGYYTEDGENYKLVTNSPDFGYEITDPNSHDENHIILTPDADWHMAYEDACSYENMVETAAWLFDKDAYKAGKIFTTYDAVKIFCSKM